jgi:hypothetical protein
VPTPAPTLVPTPEPTLAPTPVPTLTATPAPTSTPDAGGGPVAGAIAPGANGISGGGPTQGGPGTDGGLPEAPVGDVSTLVVGPGSAPGHEGSAVQGIALLAAGLPGFGSEDWLLLASRSAAISAAGSAAVAMALFTFKRRRREEDEEPPERREPHRSRNDPPLPAAHLDAASQEMALPRWRRPSLTAARKSDPGTSLAPLDSERLTFDRGFVAPDNDLERRRIRYRMVRLTDAPDELRGAEIGRLDEDDEVELLERSGLYWQVRTPLGQVGWVHKMTLGDLVAPDPTSFAPGAEEIDDDVRTAFGELQLRRVFEPEPMLGGEGLAARFLRERGVH